MIDGASRPGNQSHRGGFTLIEILLVISVIVLLAGIALPAWSYIAEKGKVNSTRAMIDGLITVIQDDDRPIVVTVPAANGIRPTAHRMWDLDNNGIVDGAPDRDPDFANTVSPTDLALNAALTGSETATYETLAAKLDYDGIHTLDLTYRESMLDNSTGRLVDAWGQDLRIDFDANKYGTVGLGIWSLGADPDDDSDNINSWEASK